MLKSNSKRVSRAGIDAFVTKMIRKSSKAPANFSRMRGLAKDTATDLKAKGKTLKIPWGLLAILIPVLIGIYLAFTWRKRPGEDGGISPGVSPDQPINLRGKDADTLLGEFGHSKPGEKGQPGRPFDEG